MPTLAVGWTEGCADAGTGRTDIVGVDGASEGAGATIGVGLAVA